MRLAEHLARFFALGASNFLPWLVKTRRASSRHSRDAWVYGHTTTAQTEYTLPPAPQLIPAIYSSAAHRRVVPCGAVPFPAVRCVLRYAFLRAYSSTRYESKYQVPGGMYVLCPRLFLCFLQLIVFSRSPSPPRPANYTRTADQNVTSPISTQHSVQHRTTTVALHKQLLALSIR